MPPGNYFLVWRIDELSQVNESDKTDNVFYAPGTIQIKANIPPSAVAESYSVNEDASLSVPSTTGVMVNDSDADGDLLTLSLVATTTNGALSLSSNGSFQYTPNANFFGTDTFTYSVSDGLASSSATVTINVLSVNDAPSFTKGANQSVLEDAGAQSVSAWATSILTGPANESGQTRTFSVTGNTNPGIFSAGPAISPTGVLTYTPATNANGPSTLTVVLVDNGGTARGGIDTSLAQSFTITVNPVNDAPSFLKGANQTVAEDPGPRTVSGWATGIAPGPSNESTQTVSFNVTGNTNPTLFSAAPSIASNGTLSYTPGPNANGSATITLVLKDNGGVAGGGVDTSSSQSFTITVTPVNDAPTGTITNPTTSETDATEFDTVQFTVDPNDVEGDILTITWGYGDGSPTDQGTTVFHQFDPGDYLVSVTMDDGNGGVTVLTTVVTVLGGAQDGDLLATKGTFAVIWSAHAAGQKKDKFTLAGILNPSGVPLALPPGAEVEIWVSGPGQPPVLLSGAPVPLLSTGAGSSAAPDGSEKAKVKVSPKNGKYAISVSSTDLRATLGIADSTVAEQPITLTTNFVFAGVPTMDHPDLLGQFGFVYSATATKASKGKFALKTNRVYSGAFVAMKTSATEAKVGGDFTVSLLAALAAGAGGPIDPVGDVTVTIGNAVPILIPAVTLLQTGIGPTSAFALPTGAVPGLTKLILSNAKKSLTIATGPLPATGIPVIGDLETAHLLPIKVEVDVAGPTTLTFETAVEILRTSTTSGKWKR